MADYKAKEGRRDRHGEMTGAITFNMIFTMVPIVIWAMFVGPAIFGQNWVPTLLISLAMALVLPFVGLKPSQRLWAWLSAKMDGF